MRVFLFLGSTFLGVIAMSAVADKPAKPKRAEIWRVWA